MDGRVPAAWGYHWGHSTGADSSLAWRKSRYTGARGAARAAWRCHTAKALCLMQGTPCLPVLAVVCQCASLPLKSRSP